MGCGSLGRSFFAGRARLTTRPRGQVIRWGQDRTNPLAAGEAACRQNSLTLVTLGSDVSESSRHVYSPRRQRNAHKVLQRQKQSLLGIQYILVKRRSATGCLSTGSMYTSGVSQVVLVYDLH